MRIFELYEVSSKPRKNDHHYYENRIYSNSLYMEAECEVECNLEEEISDEEFDKRVEEKLENMLETLKEYGRYPETGIPKFVMY